MTPSPTIFQIGPLAIRWYGLLIMIGALTGAYVASLEAKRRGHDPDHVWNGLLLCLVLGLVGARLYHVISSPHGTMVGFNYYLENPIKIVAIWEGGLDIYGAIAGGLVGLWIYARMSHISFPEWSDFAAPGLALGQAIGRWGNFFNQELYGYPTNVPWGIPIEGQYRLDEFRRLPADARFHPTFAYESLWNLAVCAILLYVARRFKARLMPGDILLFYLILYPLGRFFVEFQRPDAWTIGGVHVAQVVALVSIVASALLLIYRRRRAPAVQEEFV